MRNLDLQDFVIIGLQANSINLRDFMPVLKGDDHIEALFKTDAADTVNTRDINNTQTPNFHMEAGKVRRCADEFPALKRADAGDIVSDQAVATLDEGQDALAFTNAAGAADEDADAQDINHAAVLGGDGREVEFQADCRHVHQAHRGQGRLEDGDAFLLGDFQDHAGGIDVTGENETRDAMFEEFTQALAADRIRQRLEILGFPAADDLDALERKRFIETGKGQAGTIDRSLGNAPLQTARARQQLELQLIGVICVELADGDLRDAVFLLHGQIKKGERRTGLTCAFAAAFAMEL